MNILYYTWNEITKDDIAYMFRKLGHQVTEIAMAMEDVDADSNVMKTVMDKIEQETYDIIFSMYFLPVISKIALLKKIRYVVWLFDPLPLTGFSQMIFNPYNYIFSFDQSDCEILRGRGVKNVYHLPLAVNYQRLASVIEEPAGERLLGNEVTFLGSLYNGSSNFFEHIPCMLEETKGYVDGIIAAQMRIYGYNLIDEMVDDALVEKLERTAKISISPEYTYKDRDVFVHMIEKKASADERREILRMLCEHFPVTLYSESESSSIPKLMNKGYVHYYTEMPKIFYHSKINLNISIRLIHSGMSLRMLDIMGAGGFLLSNYQPELAEYFEDGKEMVMFESRQELLEKTRYYLDHEDERKQIARNGQKKVQEQFTYEKQLGKMFSILEA